MTTQASRRTRFLLRFGKQLDRENAKRAAAQAASAAASVPVVAIPGSDTTLSTLLAKFEEPPTADDCASELSELSDLFEPIPDRDPAWAEEDQQSGAGGRDDSSDSGDSGAMTGTSQWMCPYLRD